MSAPPPAVADTVADRSLRTLIASGFDLYAAFGASAVNAKFGTGADIDESLKGAGRNSRRGAESSDLVTNSLLLTWLCRFQRHAGVVQGGAAARGAGRRPAAHRAEERVQLPARGGRGHPAATERHQGAGHVQGGRNGAVPSGAHGAGLLLLLLLPPPTTTTTTPHSHLPRSPAPSVEMRAWTAQKRIKIKKKKDRKGKKKDKNDKRVGKNRKKVNCSPTAALHLLRSGGSGQQRAADPPPPPSPHG